MRKSYSVNETGGSISIECIEKRSHDVVIDGDWSWR
jgi:hypothetical protein